MRRDPTILLAAIWFRHQEAGHMSSSRFKTRPPPKHCIFYGGNKVTGEHMWPDWAAPVFQNVPLGVVETHGVAESGGSPRLRQRTRQGRVTQMKVHAPCGPCNSGWMNRIETAARPVIMRLQASERHLLTPAAQQSLAEWICLKIMVGEHTKRDQSVISQELRTAFYERRELPLGLTIWLFRCGDGIWKSVYYRVATTAKLFNSSDPLPDLTRNAPNVKAVSLGFNDLFIYAHFTALSALKFQLEAERFGVRLWPHSGENIGWPVDHRLSAEEAFLLSETLLRVPNIMPISEVRNV
jgi:hypothetical protein